MEAAYLLNFARFTSWSGVKDSGPVRICMLGRADLLEALISTIEGRSVNGRRVVLSEEASLSETAFTCNVVFISASFRDKRGIPYVLHSLESAGALTVGDSPDFARHGGMIGLKLDGGRFQFEVNLNAVRRAGLKLSSNVIALGTIVAEDQL